MVSLTASTANPSTKLKSGAEPAPKNKCFSCNKTVSKGYYNKKFIITKK